MAYTKMASKITATLNEAIDYIQNPDKTENLAYVYGGSCTPQFAAAQFELTKRDMGFSGRNLAYHFIQSFAPNEITPEKAHEIGKKLCDEFLKGEYEFVLATHNDKDHIHNHIIINSVNQVTGQSFSRQHDRKANPAWKAVQEISDNLCREYNLSVIKNPEGGTRKGYYEWQQDKSDSSWKSKLRADIDDCIMAANSYEDFLNLMQFEKGYKAKQGKYLAFHAEDQNDKNGRERYCRCKTLGWYYADEQLRTRIDRRIAFRSRNSGFIEIEGKVAESEGLKRWAMLQNMKSASKLINEMTEQGIDNGDKLKNRAIDLHEAQLDIGAEIRQLELREEKIKPQIKKLKAYLKLVPVNEAYRRSAEKKKFKSEHKKELELYEASRNDVKPLLKESGKLPSPQSLEAELLEIQQKKEALMSKYKGIKSEITQIQKKQKQIEQIAQLHRNNSRKQEIE